MNKWLYITGIVMACQGNSLVRAQDVHFTQHFSSPLVLNPASTGFFRGDYRVGVNHKEQWPWAIESKFLTYNTSSAFAEWGLRGRKTKKKDWFGIGLITLHDVAGDGKLRMTEYGASIAFHKQLDREGRHFISAGFNAISNRRTIDFEAFRFNSQWRNGTGFDLSLPSGEFFSQNGFVDRYWDVSLGIQTSHRFWNDNGLAVNFSLHHINRPRETFLNSENRIGIRPMITLQGSIQGLYRFTIHPSMLFTTQKGALELVIGSNFTMPIDQDRFTAKQRLWWGLHYRSVDAIIPVIGYEIARTRILMNYDINLSSLSKASRGNGGLEISLIHIGSLRKNTKERQQIYCPDDMY